MGLKVRVWVDHLTEDDRHERHSTNNRGAAWAFLNGTLAVEFRPLDEDGKRYECIAGVLKRLRYRRLRRADKGVVLRYLERTTGYSRQQLTRRVLDGEKLAQPYPGQKGDQCDCPPGFWLQGIMGRPEQDMPGPLQKIGSSVVIHYAVDNREWRAAAFPGASGLIGY